MTRKTRAYDVRLADVMTFLSVRGHGSVTGAARAMGTTPSHVSKSLARLEGQLGTRLLARSGRGVTLTSAAFGLIPLLVTAADALLKAGRGTGQSRDVTVAAPSYLLHAFVPSLVANVSTMRFRGVQMAPPSILAQASLRQFDVALSTGDSKLPASWRVEPIGELGSGLFASPALARKLGKVTSDSLRQQSFVTPVSFNAGKWEPMIDGCPLPIGERIAGHEAPTISLALAIAAQTHQLVFGPRIAARDAIAHRKLVEVKVPGWAVSTPIFLAVDIDRITSPELKLMRQVATGLLDQAA